jgi:hypothetical protein
MNKVKVDWFYAKLTIGIIIMAIMTFAGGRAYEQQDACDYFIKEHASVVRECNEKLRECSNIPKEFNLTRYLNGSRGTVVSPTDKRES